MELKKIQYFLRIADKRSLTKAAESLYLTQPTLSRFLDKLEQEAGIPLFVRRKNSILELTDAGIIYLKTARQIHDLWSGLENELSSVRRAANNHILFGICGDNLQKFASDCADSVRKRYPGTTVEFICDSSLTIQKLVASGEIDIGIAAYLETDPNLTYFPCTVSEMDLVVSHENKLPFCSVQLAQRNDQRLSLRELASDTHFALMREGPILRQTVDRYFQQEKLQPHIQKTYMRHNSLVKILTDDPSLVGFCPAKHHSDQLTHIALDPPFYYTQGVCYRKSAHFTQAQQYLLQLLKKQPKTRNLD